MTAPKEFAWSFIDIAAVRENRAFMAASYYDTSESKVSISAVLSWDGSWSRKAFEIAAVSMCLLLQPQVALLMLGSNGKVVRWGTQDFSEEWIVPMRLGLEKRNA